MTAKLFLKKRLTFVNDDHQVDLFLQSSEEDPQAILGDTVKNDCIDELAKDFLSNEETGPPLADNLTKLIENIVGKRMQKEKIKEIMEKTLKPSNIPILTTPEINNQIWMKIKPEMKQKDRKLGKISDKIAKGLTAMVRVTESLGGMKEKVKDSTVKQELKSLTKLRQLLITTQKPHYVKMDENWNANAGIDLGIFTPHSLRVAAANAALRYGVSLDTLFKTGGWTRENTFRCYYQKPIIQQAGFSMDNLAKKSRFV